MTPDLGRFDDWLAWLPEHAAADPDLHAVWVGGSAATGGWDEWSDLDVVLLAAPGTSVSAYERLLSALRARFAPDHVWELPPGTWPDGRQCFVNPQPRAGRLDEPTRGRSGRCPRPARTSGPGVKGFMTSTLANAGGVRHPWNHGCGLGACPA